MSDSLESRVRRLEADAYRRSQAPETSESMIGKGLAEMLRQVASLQVSIGELEQRHDWLETKMAEQITLLVRVAGKLDA